MSNRREFLSRFAIGGVGVLSIPGLSIAHGFRRRSNNYCVPVDTCSTYSSSCGCPIQFNGQIDDTYYYYCIKCGVNSQNMGFCGAYDGIAPSGSSSQPHDLKSSTTPCSSCEPPTGNCIPIGGMYGFPGWPFAGRAASPSDQVDTYASVDFNNIPGKTTTGATHYADAYDFQPNPDSSAVTVTVVQPLKTGSNPNGIAWYYDTLGNDPTLAIGAKLWKITASWKENGVKIEPPAMYIGMEVQPPIDQHFPQIHQGRRNQHHHTVHHITGVQQYRTYSILTNHVTDNDPP